MIAPSTGAIDTRPRDISERCTKIPSARILVVDDDHLVRWAIAETLGDAGYDVFEAADGNSAQRTITAAGDPFDLVLLDLRLPDCDDLCMVSFIRAYAPATPIVVMTAFATREIAEGASRLGAVVVSKPFDMNQLTSIVERAFAPRPA